MARGSELLPLAPMDPAAEGEGVGAGGLIDMSEQASQLFNNIAPTAAPTIAPSDTGTAGIFRFIHGESSFLISR